MGLFLSSSCFWVFAGSLFAAGRPFFVPSPMYFATNLSGAPDNIGDAAVIGGDHFAQIFGIELR
jgi:hypothetical protein